MDIFKLLSLKTKCFKLRDDIILVISLWSSADLRVIARPSVVFMEVDFLDQVWPFLFFLRKL